MGCIYIELLSQKAFMMPHIHPRHAIQQQPGNQEPTCSTTFAAIALHMCRECNRFSGKSHKIDSIFSLTGILLVCLSVCPSQPFCFPIQPTQSSPLFCTSVSYPVSSSFPSSLTSIEESSLTAWKLPLRADRKQRLLGLSYRNPTSNSVLHCVYIFFFPVWGFKENLWQQALNYRCENVA